MHVWLFTYKLLIQKNGTETRPQAAKVVGNGALKESYYNNYEKENMDEKNKKKNKNKHLNGKLFDFSEYIVQVQKLKMVNY